ncbi:MAG: phytanoyl-CoA dioxygenase family protein [Gemmatimonadetes bacterium]|jgi:ectoine hydroxylase-related dioxygenase (phytanoyl-CoA dioxygenase family)|nr:phytanoyl-CoA dioxygenase family protein [Gemmatimonadota bacterium]MBT5056959.1 phytanoyl-CoA dioxygenase family protein [Gemmatimonadota bacterium]MBT5142212.1 phytanoyl-CoA dioxygenase family protein [Gemmatimonadota bacterium]MBT5589203.1 phytanoyl-CoA dioxygenase family protein [Gemmatimonadota bacterium]MBT5963147.1 phytanoyl-CoA dioxygenase family protein [Gemmatimonadota bacterium]
MTVAPHDLNTAYQRDGYVTRLDLFSTAEMQTFRASFDALESREGPEKCAIGLQGRHMDEEFIWQMAADPRVIEAVSACMGEDVMLLSTHFFCKYPDPDNKKYVAWHQDITYWGLEPPEAHTAWIAVDDADIENGCMEVISGSHRDGIATHGTSESTDNLLSIHQEIPDDLVDSSQAVPIELTAGQASIHDGQLFHASRPNRSDRRRCGLTVRFIPPAARQVEKNSTGQQWLPILVRGEDPYHHYPETPAPFPFPGS